MRSRKLCLGGSLLLGTSSLVQVGLIVRIIVGRGRWNRLSEFGASLHVRDDGGWWLRSALRGFVIQVAES